MRREEKAYDKERNCISDRSVFDGLWRISFRLVQSGVSIDTVPYVVSEILQTDLGLCTSVVFAVYIFLQFLLLGKRFPPQNILQIIVATIQEPLSA